MPKHLGAYLSNFSVAKWPKREQLDHKQRYKLKHITQFKSMSLILSAWENVKDPAYYFKNC